MLSLDSTNRLNRVCLLMTQVELSIRRISCLPSGVLSANQFNADGYELGHPSVESCEPVPINGEPVVLYRRLASCAVRPSACQPAVLYFWLHTVRGLAVLRASSEQESRRADDVTCVLSLFRYCA